MRRLYSSVHVDVCPQISPVDKYPHAQPVINVHRPFHHVGSSCVAAVHAKSFPRRTQIKNVLMYLLGENISSKGVILISNQIIQTYLMNCCHTAKITRGLKADFTCLVPFLLIGNRRADIKL